MDDKSFILMSLKEDKVKKMTQVLNSKTCRKIIEYLSKQDKATATDISKDLDMAMSTVHYNLKQLVENDLVTSNDYHYSKKGKEIIHYGLANKYIIIAPREDKSVLDKLKGFLPITFITAATGAVIYLVETQWQRLISMMPWAGGLVVTESATKDSVGVFMHADAALEPAARMMVESSAVEPTATMLIAPWFLLGAAFVILVMVARDLSKKK